MALLQVLSGLVLLILAGDALVRGAVALAERLGVPTLIISLTIIAFGTSAPELIVGINAVISGSPTLALGNVVGSNIANILLVIGLPAIILPVACNASNLDRNYLIMIAGSFLAIGFALNGMIDRLESAILVGCLCAFLLYSTLKAQSARRERKLAATQNSRPKEIIDDADTISADISTDISGSSLLDANTSAPNDKTLMGNIWISLILLIAGLGGLSLGADLLVTGSVTIARTLGISEAVIGLTLVAVGTSLPELVTALTAAFKKQSDVAVGSVIGSNIFNILGILGISGLVGTIPVPDSFITLDLWIMVGASILLAPFIKIKKSVGRITGIAMISAYIGYLVLIAS